MQLVARAYGKASGLSDGALASGVCPLPAPQLREQDDLADAASARQDHHEAVDTHAETAGGRHPVLDRRQELLVEAVGVLVLEPASEQFLLFHALPLVERIVQLGEGVANLHTGDEALEPLHQA